MRIQEEGRGAVWFAHYVVASHYYASPWEQGGAATCSKKSILNLCWWSRQKPHYDALEHCQSLLLAALSPRQIFGEMNRTSLHINGPHQLFSFSSRRRVWI